MNIEKLLVKMAEQIEEIAQKVQKIDVIEKDVAELKEDVSGLKEDVSGLKEDVSGLKEDVTGLKEDVIGLKEDVSGLKEDVSGLKEDVSGLKEDVSGIKQRISTLDFIEEKVKLIDLLVVKTNEIKEELNSLNNKFDATINTDVALIFNKQVDMEEGMKNIRNKIEKNSLEHKKFDYELTKLKLKYM